MRHGNLSSQLAPIIGIRFENVIYNFGKVNQPGKGFVEHLLQEDCNVYFITTLPERKAIAWCYKYGVGYTRIIEAAGPLEIPEITFHNKMLAYYDTDDRILEQVSMRGNPQTKGIKWEQALRGPSKSINN